MRKSKILIIDDQRSHLRLIKKMLSRFCWQAVPVDSAEEAEFILEWYHNFCAVITDLKMPWMNGVEFCTRAKRKYPDIKIVKMNSELGCPQRWLRIFELFTVVILVVACAHPQATLAPQADMADPFQRFKNKLDNLRNLLRIPGMSISVLREQEIVFKEGFGCADIEKQIPATATTSYHIAS